MKDQIPMPDKEWTAWLDEVEASAPNPIVGKRLREIAALSPRPLVDYLE